MLATRGQGCSLSHARDEFGVLRRKSLRSRNGSRSLEDGPREAPRVTRAKRVLEWRHAVPKPEVSEIIEIKAEIEEVVVYRNFQSVKRSRREQVTFLLLLSVHCRPLRVLGPRRTVSPSGDLVEPYQPHGQLRDAFICILFRTICVSSDFVLRENSCAAVPSDSIDSILCGLRVNRVGQRATAFLSCPGQLHIRLIQSIM